MKKLITLIAMFVIAGVASAALVDGDFSAQTILALTDGDNPVGNGNAEYAYSEFDENLNWLQADHSYWDLQASGGQSGGYASFDGNEFGRMLTQTWQDSASSTGTGWELSFYVNVDIAQANSQLDVDVVGLDDLWSTRSWNARMSMRNYGVTSASFPLNSNDSRDLGYILGSTTVDVTGAMGWTKYTISGIDLGAGYEYISLVFSANSDETAGAVIGLDTVAFAVPEPATVGMLGLGALVALMVRRIRG